MRKIFILYGALILVVILLLIWRAGGLNLNLFGPTAKANVNNKQISLLVADDQKERMTGLSNRNSLNDTTGMLFIFENKSQYPFWMKNMKFPIDIIYLDDNTVVDVKSNVPVPKSDDPNPPVYTPSKKANYVLELNAGGAKRYNISKGTRITFQNLPKK